jgi:hypothetical protein
MYEQLLGEGAQWWTVDDHGQSGTARTWLGVTSCDIVRSCALMCHVRSVRDRAKKTHKNLTGTTLAECRVAGESINKLLNGHWASGRR